MELSELLVALRRSRGLSQFRLAELLNDSSGRDTVTRTEVSRWERGRRTPSTYWLPWLADVLGVQLTQLEQAKATKWPTSGSLSSNLNGSETAPFGLEGVRPSTSPARLPLGSADQIDELVLHLRDQWHALVRTDNLLGPRYALAAVLNQISIIVELLPLCTGTRRAEVLALGATYAESASWLNEDAGQISAATFWVDRATRWAREAEDRLLLAWALFRRSQHAAADHDVRRTINLARAARRNQQRLPSPMRAAIVQQQAQGYALDGQELLAHRTIDEAHRWASHDADGDARGGHGSFCNAEYLELQRAHCWTSLGKPQRAIQAYEAVLPTLPPVYRRDRAVACARFARAQAIAGQPEAAADSAREALAIARSAGSQRAEHDVVLVAHHLEGFRHLEPVAQFVQDLSRSPAT